MEKIYDVDYPALDDDGKAKFVEDFAELAEKSFAEQPFSINVQAQLLIFTRWWNSYRLMAPEEPTPPILETAIERLWKYQAGEDTPEDFARFTKNMSAAALDIMTGDDSELNEDPVCEAFYEEHFRTWPMVYNIYLSNLTILFEAIVREDRTWYGVADTLYGDIGDCMIELFEEVYTNPTHGYHFDELQRRDRDIYRSPTFCRVVAQMQQDMRAALLGKSVEELRRAYQNEELFSPEMCAKIT